MTTKKDMVFINQYGQGLVEEGAILEQFRLLGPQDKQEFFTGLLFLISQSKPDDNDIESTILQSRLKPAYTPCVLLQKGVAPHHLEKIANLPEYESEKSCILLLNLFKIAYYRRFKEEKNDPDKWWYWDLSDERNLKKIISAN